MYNTSIYNTSSLVSYLHVVYHQPAKFGGHRHCDSGDMFSVCYVISHDHLYKESYYNINL